MSSAFTTGKQISAVISKVLPKPIPHSIRPKGSRLAHLYGLQKTHKEQLAMRPILSAMHTYNYALAKLLVVSLAAVFSLVTQRSGDETKNEGD